jgi:hypothetical protein
MAIIVLTTIDMADGSAAGLKAIIPQQPGIRDLLGTAFSSVQRLKVFADTCKWFCRCEKDPLR